MNKGFTAKVYYNCEPGGPYFELAKREVELIHVDAPNEVFGRPVELLAHKANVLRLQILLEHGGIYSIWTQSASARSNHFLMVVSYQGMKRKSLMA